MCGGIRDYLSGEMLLRCCDFFCGFVPSLPVCVTVCCCRVVSHSWVLDDMQGMEVFVEYAEREDQVAQFMRGDRGCMTQQLAIDLLAFLYMSVASLLIDVLIGRQHPTDHNFSTMMYDLENFVTMTCGL